MNDPQKKPPKAPNQWLAQQDSIKRLSASLTKRGIPVTTKPAPLQPGSAVITIPFPKGPSEATEK